MPAPFSNGPDDATTQYFREASGRAIDGLFKMIAAEEKLIRQDPPARGTGLLRKVFGSGQRPSQL